MDNFNLKKYFNKQYLTEQEDKDSNIVPEAELILPRGKKVVLQAEDTDYKRGLIVELLDNGGYEMAYWYNKPNKPYPVEILVDGQSIKPDGKVVEMKFHPQDYYDKQDELNEAIDLDIDDEFQMATLSGKSGKYTGYVDDGVVSFSVSYEDREDKIDDFYNESNIDEFIGKDHAFMELAKKYNHKWDIGPDYVEIEIDLKSPLNEAFDELDDGYDQEMEDLIKAGPRLNKDRFEDVIYYIHNNWMAGNYGDDYAIRRISKYLNAR